MAFGAPGLDGDSFVMDFATSAAAEGKVRVARDSGKSVPEGWIRDSEGRATTNPNDFYDGGTMLTFGEHKGSAIAIMTTLLSVVTASAADDIADGASVFGFAIDPNAFGRGDETRAVIQHQLTRVRSAAPAGGFSDVQVPGDFERRSRAALAGGPLQIPEPTWKASYRRRNGWRSHERRSRRWRWRKRPGRQRSLVRLVRAMASDRLRTHDVTLRTGHVVLRPLTEDDWDLVVGWWNDPQIADFADAEPSKYTARQVQKIVRGISSRAYCFIIEFEGRPVGECWLQEMNMKRILERNPGLDCRRIDLAIEKASWGQGIGTAAIRLLVGFGFESECADAIFAMDVADYNRGSRRAVEKAGFELCDTVPQPAGARARVRHDLVIRAERGVGGMAEE